MSTAEPGKGKGGGEGKTGTGWLLLWLLLAVAGVGGWVFLMNGPEYGRAWRSLLINFLFFSSLSGGLVVWPALVRTCNGRWHLRVERLAAAGITFAVPSVLALVALWVGSPQWAPWHQARFHQGIWLDNSFLFGRDLMALLTFWGFAVCHLQQRRKGGGRRCGIVLLLVYCLTFSLLGFDLVMALDPHFHSSLAGGYFFISGLYIALTFWAFLASWQRESAPDELHDLGKLMVGFSLMTTYLMYAHLLPFWYENLPREVRFLVPRMHNEGWSLVSYLLLCLVYFGPMVLLLPARFKRSRRPLGVVSSLVLLGMWVERWWLVTPTFDPLVRLGLSELSLAAGFAGLLGLGMLLYRQHLPGSHPAQENEP